MSGFLLRDWGLNLRLTSESGYSFMLDRMYSRHISAWRLCWRDPRYAWALSMGKLGAHGGCHQDYRPYKTWNQHDRQPFPSLNSVCRLVTCCSSFFTGFRSYEFPGQTHLIPGESTSLRQVGVKLSEISSRSHRPREWSRRPHLRGEKHGGGSRLRCMGHTIQRGCSRRMGLRVGQLMLCAMFDCYICLVWVSRRQTREVYI